MLSRTPKFSKPTVSWIALGLITLFSSALATDAGSSIWRLPYTRELATAPTLENPTCTWQCEETGTPSAQSGVFQGVTTVWNQVSYCRLGRKCPTPAKITGSQNCTPNTVQVETCQ